MLDPARVSLSPWAPGDRFLLDRANTSAMTEHLGGPEPAGAIERRHENYLRLSREGTAEMFRIDVDGAPAGGIGFWQVDHDGVPAYETGWNTLPEFQGRGVATAALARIVARVRERGDRDLLVAYPWRENAASTALCRRAGFEHRGSSRGPWRGREVAFENWVLDMTPIDLTDRTPDVEERFVGARLDESRWWPHYTPHWSSRAQSAARYDVTDAGLQLRIEEDTPPWAPEWDGEVRCSHVQTGQLSGPVGSRVGQHRFREGLVVREQQPEHRGWLTRFGVIEVRMAAVRHPDAMVAFWPIGFEERPDDCGEICIAEIFGSDLDDTGGWVGVGVKPQNDPRLRPDFEKIRIAGDLTSMHDYAVEWSPERLRFFVDGRWVKTVAQRIDYPVQFMLDLYELPGAGPRDIASLPHRFRVERVRTFPPR